MEDAIKNSDYLLEELNKRIEITKRLLDSDISQKLENIKTTREEIIEDFNILLKKNG